MITCICFAYSVNYRVNYNKMSKLYSQGPEPSLRNILQMNNEL